MPLNYKKSSTIASFFLGSLLYLPLKTLGLLFVSEKDSPIKRILIQDGYRLGDIIMLSRVFSGLHQKYQGAEIHLLSSPEACDLLKNAHWVDKLLPYKAPWCFKSGFFHSIILFIKMAIKLSRNKYDIAIDFQGDPRGCALLYVSRIPTRFSTRDFGASAFCSKTWNIPSTIQHQVFRYEFLFQKISDTTLPPFDHPLWPQQHNDIPPINSDSKKRILIHPGASSVKRRWQAENFAILIGECINKNYSTSLIGGPGDRSLLETICTYTSDKLNFFIPTFSELESLLLQTDCIVCNDSFMSHVSWAINKKSIIIFGPGNPHQVAPFTGANTIIWNDQILNPPFMEWTGPVSINKTSPSTVLSAIQKHIEGRI
jgi:ADP-heptose:LPS heptosyltransferase